MSCLVCLRQVDGESLGWTFAFISFGTDRKKWKILRMPTLLPRPWHFWFVGSRRTDHHRQNGEDETQTAK